MRKRLPVMQNNRTQIGGYLLEHGVVTAKSDHISMFEDRSMISECVDGMEGTMFSVEMGPKARLTIGVTEVLSTAAQSIDAQILFAYANDDKHELIFKTAKASEIIAFMKSSGR